MCGIAGCFGKGGQNDLTNVAARMAKSLSHRGPDDSGVWVDASAGIALAHRRLAILDLSPAGHQPMMSHSGRYVIVFNGEIYNHLELRESLMGIVWRGHSDTETLLAVIEARGVAQALNMSVGMFAFALWDRQRRILTLVRDRMGEKPLYYGWQGDSFLFGSELKALRAHPDFCGEIDRDALTLFLRHNYIPAPRSIYLGIGKLPPGCSLSMDFSAGAPAVRDVAPSPYWSVKGAIEAGRSQPFSGSDQEAATELELLLRQSLRGQMLADVPLGAFLSGGIDSSIVAAIMQAESARPVKTFTIGFHEGEYNEAHHAHQVARHLGTDHTELYVMPEDAQAVIPKLPALYDEPFADSSQIPTFLVAHLARRHVTVALSGDGGDELFGGYSRYFHARSIWNTLRHAPHGLRKLLARGMRSMPVSAWNALAYPLMPWLGSRWRARDMGDRVHKFAEIVEIENRALFYRRMVSHWKRPADIVIGCVEPHAALSDSALWSAVPGFEECMMYLDQITYLPDDILVKVDRAAMGVSLETRVPMLDHRLVEFAWRLPLCMKIREGKGKWLLRQVLYRHVPKALIERPKMGFGVPIDQWLRGPLREWAESLLDESRLRREGYFEPAPIRKKWGEHLSRNRNWSYYLWDVLMFQAWLEAQSG